MVCPSLCEASEAIELRPRMGVLRRKRKVKSEVELLVALIMRVSTNRIRQDLPTPTTTRELPEISSFRIGIALALLRDFDQNNSTSIMRGPIAVLTTITTP